MKNPSVDAYVFVYKITILENKIFINIRILITFFFFQTTSWDCSEYVCFSNFTCAILIQLKKKYWKFGHRAMNLYFPDFNKFSKDWYNWSSSKNIQQIIQQFLRTKTLRKFFSFSVLLKKFVEIFPECSRCKITTEAGTLQHTKSTLFHRQEWLFHRALTLNVVRFRPPHQNNIWTYPRFTFSKYGTKIFFESMIL